MHPNRQICNYLCIKILISFNIKSKITKLDSNYYDVHVQCTQYIFIRTLITEFISVTYVYVIKYI